MTCHAPPVAPARHSVVAGLLGAVAFLGGCAVAPPSGTSLDPRGVSLERDFRGRSYASGIFTNRLTGGTRGLKVVLDGRWNGRALTLREDFVYSDGETDVKTWVFTRTGPGRYVGTREDVVGEATITEENGIVRLAYDVDQPTSAGKIRLRFEDVIERRADGMIVNRAVVSKLGVPLGDVDLTFSRRPLP